MRKIIMIISGVLLTIIILVLGLYFFYDKEEVIEVDPKTYEGYKLVETDLYSYSYPEKWSEPEVIKGQKGSQILNLPNGTSSISIVKDELPLKYSLEVYFNNTVKNLKEAGYVKKGKFKTRDTNYNGYVGKAITYEYSSDNIDYKVEQVVFLPRNKLAYVFTYTTMKDNFDDDYEVIKKTFDSFALNK